MQKTPKIGLLILLLAIPIFFVLFFELFSTSHYTVPVFYENGIDSLSQCEPSQDTHQVAKFSAFNVRQQETQLLQFDSIQRVVYVLSSGCDDTCAAILEELRRVSAVLESEYSLQVVLLGDSATLSTALVEKYDINQSEWIFLEGTEPGYASFLQCELVLPRKDIPLHQTLVLVDEQGRVRGYYLGTDTAEVDRLIAELRILQYIIKETDSNAENRTG